MPLKKIRLTKLRRHHFVDKDDLDVGSLQDLTLDRFKLTPKHLILGSNFFEELLEEMGKKANIDEVASVDTISGVQGNFVILNEKYENLEVTDEEGNLPESFEEIKYSDLSELNIIDREEKGGMDLIDYEMDGDNSRLIFNYPDIQYELMPEGFMQRFEISFHVKDITLSGENIITPSSKDEVIKKVKSTIEPKMKGKSTVLW